MRTGSCAKLSGLETGPEMRVIGGELRGRRLEAPEGLDTRPMLDRVREPLFSTLTPWLAGGTVLDLFAGSGSLGIEALSRGARSARFVETATKALLCLRQNVAALALDARAEVVRGDAMARANWGGPADVVFVDSPYPLLDDKKARARLFVALAELVATQLAPEGVLVFHAPRRAVFASEFGTGVVLREREYGTNSLWYAQREGAPAGAPAAEPERAAEEPMDREHA